MAKKKTPPTSVRLGDKNKKGSTLNRALAAAKKKRTPPHKYIVGLIEEGLIRDGF